MVTHPPERNPFKDNSKSDPRRKSGELTERWGVGLRPGDLRRKGDVG